MGDVPCVGNALLYISSFVHIICNLIFLFLFSTFIFYAMRCDIFLDLIPVVLPHSFNFAIYFFNLLVAF